VSAIDGGVDGLDLTRVCLQVASDHLARGGVMLLQVAGEPQARAVLAVLETTAAFSLIHLETRHHDPDRAVMLLTSGAPISKLSTVGGGGTGTRPGRRRGSGNDSCGPSSVTTIGRVAGDATPAPWQRQRPLAPSAPPPTSQPKSRRG